MKFDLIPFRGVPSVPDDVREWAAKLSDEDWACTQSGQWMAKRSYQGGPVEFWLHICDTPGKGKDAK